MIAFSFSFVGGGRGRIGSFSFFLSKWCVAVFILNFVQKHTNIPPFFNGIFSLQELFKSFPFFPLILDWKFGNPTSSPHQRFWIGYRGSWDWQRELEVWGRQGELVWAGQVVAAVSFFLLMAAKGTFFRGKLFFCDNKKKKQPSRRRKGKKTQNFVFHLKKEKEILQKILGVLFLNLRKSVRCCGGAEAFFPSNF